jgi:hypothetical protein
MEERSSMMAHHFIDCPGRVAVAGNPATVRKRYEGTDPSGAETGITFVPGDA